ncbi:MAG: VCBS repeat-containing protein [Polyangia bacterium]
MSTTSKTRWRAAALAGGLTSALAGGCKIEGGVVHVTAAAGVAPQSYCLSLAASGTRRFGRRYEASAYPLPQLLGVRADGQSTMLARVDALTAGLRTSSSGASVTLPGDAQLTVSACAPRTATAPFAQRTNDSIALAGSRVAFVHTGLEIPGASSVVVVAQGGGTIASYQNGALVHFATPVGGSNVEALASLDVDGDCADDLLVAVDGAPVATWSSVSDGTLAIDSARLGDTQAAHALALGDLDGDGWADLVKVGIDGGSVLLSDRAHGFVTAPGGFSVQPTNSTAAAVGDIDLDGKPDVVLGFSDGPLLWTKGDGQGGFDGLTLLPGTQQTAALALVDVNNDGSLDVLAAVNGAATGLVVYLNDGHGQFKDASFAWVPAGLDANLLALRVVDADGDCVDDVLVAGATTAPHLLALSPTGLVDRGPIGSDPVVALDAADLDGDGLPEIVGLGFGSVDIYSTTAQAQP